MKRSPWFHLIVKVAYGKDKSLRFYIYIYIYTYIYVYMPFKNFIFGCTGVFVALHGLSPVLASRGYSSLRCAGCSLRSFSCCRVQALGVQVSAVARGLSCSAVRRIFLDQGSNLCPLVVNRQIPIHCTATEVQYICF